MHHKLQQQPYAFSRLVQQQQQMASSSDLLGNSGYFTEKQNTKTNITESNKFQKQQS